MTQALLYATGLIAAISAAGLAWLIRWLNARGLEVVASDVPDFVPDYLVELVARAGN